MRRRSWSPPRIRGPKMPKGTEIRAITTRYVNPDVRARVQVLQELVELYKPFVDRAALRSGGANGTQKTLDRLDKLVSRGGSPFPEEAETALVMAVELCEKTVGINQRNNKLSHKKPSVERKRVVARTRPPKQLQLLEFLEQELGLRGKVRIAYEDEAADRAAEGDGCIIYSAAYAKNMVRRFRSEGKAAVLFGEIPTIAKALAVGDDGLNPHLYVQCVGELCASARQVTMKKKKEDKK